MLGLLYPAVLGSVLFLWLGEAAKQVMLITSYFWLGSSYHFESLITVKFLLLLVTLSFYFCDFLYIYFTNDYKWWYFFCDLGFLVTLYFTMFSIHIDSTAPPNNTVIVICYALFMILYLGWDLSERRHSEGREKKYYERVVRWEYGSLLILAVFTPWTYLSSTSYLSWLVFAVLAVITSLFAKYACEKREFYTRSGPTLGDTVAIDEAADSKRSHQIKP
jgi:hypothetical protein